MAVGVYLSTHRLQHGELKRLAEHVGTTTRTLRNWRGREGQSGSPGRPPHSAEARAQAREQTERVWKPLPCGHNGSRSACAALGRDGVDIAVRLVRDSVRDLKREAKQRERRRIEANRMHVDVLVRDAIWALDQTQLLPRKVDDLRALVVRECFVPHTLGLSIGGPACGRDVVRLLEQVARDRGVWPLVLQLDNGPENRNGVVRACLRRRRVIVLWNEPRTPQHNPRVERSIGSLKRASGLGGLAATREAASDRLIATWRALDAQTPRVGLMGLTPAELDRIGPRADDRVRRARFHEDARRELQRVAVAQLDARARRKAQREAIWRTLERHGLVTRTRGGCPIPTLKGEEIS